jgi:transcriptional regulator with XRE-family HTH domain
MADYRTEKSVGERIQAARKERGIRSTRALSDAIGDGGVSEATLQNIEAGRLSNLSVAQLLNIAYALKVAPSFLLAPIADPQAKIDLPNLSSELASMSSAEFDAWLIGTDEGPYRSTDAEEMRERTQLAAFRALQRLTRERRRLIATHELDIPSATNDRGPEAHNWNSRAERLELINREIEETTAYLAAAGWKVAAGKDS